MVEMLHETQRARRSKVVELLLRLAFFGALSLVAYGIFRMTGWHLLYVLIAVDGIGFLLLAGWDARRRRRDPAEYRAA